MFCAYLLSEQKFTVIWDHKAAELVFIKYNIHGLIESWKGLLVEYHFVMEYCPEHETELSKIFSFDCKTL